MKPKLQAFKDMLSLGMNLTVLYHEKDILLATRTEFSTSPTDFRMFNGGHNKKNDSTSCIKKTI